MPAMDYKVGTDTWDKTCSTCERTFRVEGKTWDDAFEAMLQFFYEYKISRTSGSGLPADRLHGRCKECHSHGVHKRQSNGLRREEMLFAQDGTCAICLQEISFEDSTAAVDHNHKTGNIRGILCYRCNHGLGHFADDVMKLKYAIMYLEKYHEDN